LPLEFYVFIVMLFSFAMAVFVGKFPIGVSLVIASILGALVAGCGLPLRHFVEGSFAYFDPILIIASAMIFMEIINATGALGEISRLIIVSLHHRPFWMLSLITIFIMFPGMITGLSTTAVLTTGAIVAPALIHLGIPRIQAGSIIAMAALYGMIAPPVNLPVMIIGGGVDMPYLGFELPLLFAALPIAIISTICLGYKYVKTIDIHKIKNNLPESQINKYGFRLFLPIGMLIFLMLATRLFPGKLTALGMPLIFFSCSLSAFRTGKPFSYLVVAKKAMENAMPVLGILVGIGVFIQIMSLTGVRGFLIVKAVQLPSFWLYLGIAITLPLFGAVSSFGASYVLGVPFLLALLDKNEIIVTSALTLIASLGDLMPPTALAGIFAAQVVGESNYFRILKSCLPFALLTALVGIVMIVLANALAKILVF